MSAHAWSPAAEGSAQIVALISEYLDPRANQREMLGRLEACAKFPDFNNYLAHVLTSDVFGVFVRAPVVSGGVRFETLPAPGSACGSRTHDARTC